jgi:hypothetical protein
MAEQTTSSIVVDADPAAIMEVIGDFPAYPQWAKGVQKAEVVKDGPEGWAEQVFFVLDVSIPLIGMHKRKGEKILIDTALKGLKKRVESLG